MSGPEKESPKPELPKPKPNLKHNEEKAQPELDPNPSDDQNNEQTPFKQLIKLLLKMLKIRPSAANDSYEKKKEQDEKYIKSKELLEKVFLNKKNMNKMEFKHLDPSSLLKLAMKAIQEANIASSNTASGPSKDNKPKQTKPSEKVPNRPKSPITVDALKQQIEKMAKDRGTVAADTIKNNAQRTVHKRELTIPQTSKASKTPKLKPPGSNQTG